MAEPLPLDTTPTEFARKMEISVPYASQVLSGVKPLPRGLAIKVWREWEAKLGPIAKATDDEIATLERFEAAA